MLVLMELTIFISPLPLSYLCHPFPVLFSLTLTRQKLFFLSDDLNFQNLQKCGKIK